MRKKEDKSCLLYAGGGALMSLIFFFMYLASGPCANSVNAGEYSVVNDRYSIGGVEICKMSGNWSGTLYYEGGSCYTNEPKCNKRGNAAISIGAVVISFLFFCGFLCTKAQDRIEEKRAKTSIRAVVSPPPIPISTLSPAPPELAMSPLREEA